MAIEFKKYRRKQIAELRPYESGEVLSDRVSISPADKEAGSPKLGDMIARNPASRDDQWLIAADYFAVNFEAADAPGGDFAYALSMLRAGKRMQRVGWNGKGMFVVLQKGYPDGIPINKNTAEATGIPEGTVCRFAPYLMFRAADGSFFPWVTSQADVLAVDWQILE